MSPEEEIVRRIKDSGLKAAAVAREAGLSKQYIYKITSGEVCTLKPETRRRIIAALDKLAAQAGGISDNPLSHPAIETLLTAPDRAQAAAFDLDFLRAYRHIQLPGPDGEPLILETIDDLLDHLRPLQRTWRQHKEA